MKYPLEPGTIFSNSNGYWKITGEPYCIFGSESKEAEYDFNNRYNSNYKGAYYMSYPVIRCNKNGREFKEVNGFNVLSVKEENIVGTAPLGIKVSTDGIDSGNIKRKIKFLENRINEYNIELLKLKEMV